MTHNGVLERHGVLATVDEEHGDDAEEGHEHRQTPPRPLQQQVPEPPHWRHAGTKGGEETYMKGSLIQRLFCEYSTKLLRSCFAILEIIYTQGTCFFFFSSTKR